MGHSWKDMWVACLTVLCLFSPVHQNSCRHPRGPRCTASLLLLPVQRQQRQTSGQLRLHTPIWIWVGATYSYPSCVALLDIEKCNGVFILSLSVSRRTGQIFHVLFEQTKQKKNIKRRKRMELYQLRMNCFQLPKNMMWPFNPWWHHCISGQLWSKGHVTWSVWGWLAGLVSSQCLTCSAK